MVNTDFIEKCFNEWMKEHPDSSYVEFRLLCRFWMHIHDNHYGTYIDTDDMSSEYDGISFFKDEQNVDYKKLYKERLNSKYGNFMKGDENNEGTEGNV